jgi:hypothetical protein
MLPFLSPRSPNSMLSLCHGILPITTLNWGRGDGEANFVLLMFNNNLVILAGIVSRVLSKIVAGGSKNSGRECMM